MGKIKVTMGKEDRSLAGNMLISGICKPLSMVVYYIYIPIVLDYLGVEKYGVWSTILTILSWVSYFDIGIGNGLRNRLTESLSKEDGESRKLVTSAYAFIACIMLVASVVFASCAPLINWERILGVTAIDENLTSLITMSVCFVAVNFFFSTCKNVLYALQQSANVSIMELAVQVINFIGVLIARRLYNSNLSIIAFIYGMSMILVDIITSLFVYRKHKYVCPDFRKIDVSTGKELVNLGVRFFVIQICALVLFTTDSVIISVLYGAVDVTPYNIVNKLFTAVSSIYCGFITPVWSTVTKAKTESRFKDIEDLIRKLDLMMVPFFAGAILLAFVFRPVTHLWLGKDLEYTNTLIAFGCVYSMLTMWCNSYASVSNGLQIMKISMCFAIIQVIVNIPASFFLALTMKMGNAGVLGGTVISMMLGAAVSPITVNNRLNKLKKGKVINE